MKFSSSALFHMKTRGFLKYFFRDCSTSMKRVLNHMPCALSWTTHLRAHVPLPFMCPPLFMCLTCLHFFTCPTYSHFLRALHAFIFFPCLRCHIFLRALIFIRVLHAFIFTCFSFFNLVLALRTFNTHARTHARKAQEARRVQRFARHVI